MELKNSLVNPLTKEEQQKLLEDYKINGNFEARQKLIIHNLKLISFVINKKFNIASYDDDDLFFSGVIGLINAIDTFNPDKNNKFSTYATKCIYTQILKFINPQNKINQKEISFETPITTNNKDEELTIYDYLYDENVNIEKEYDNLEQTEFINEMLSILSDEERLIIDLRFGLNNHDPHEVSEIAKMFDLTRQHMHNKIKDILLKIKKNMALYYKTKRTERRNALKKYYDSISHKKFDI